MALLVRKLDLRAPIRREIGDRITAFDVNEKIANSPEVDLDTYTQSFSLGVPVDEIPTGHYLFAQSPGEGDDRTIAEEAVELQKEGLWKTLSLDTRLYLRVLSEESGSVRQLMRRIKDEA
ncbi:MAG: hypothetical protein WCT14_14890 [Treponemataceae bacterium]